MEFRMEIRIRMGGGVVVVEGGNNRPFQNKKVWGERKKGEILGNPQSKGRGSRETEESI